MPDFLAPADLSEENVALLIETGRAQAQLINELESALEKHDDALALRLAREIVGLERPSQQGVPAT
jgi:hypothetical protein